MTHIAVPRRGLARAARGVAAVALLLGTPAAAHAQFGTIAGTALDSLHSSRLHGAFVTVEGLGRNAVTDSAGDFRIDSVPPGAHRLAVFHPLLDTLGLALMTQSLQVAADSVTDVIVSVPSAATVLRVKCGPEADAAIIGSVSRADDPNPPTDATVLLRWVEVQVGRDVGVRQVDRSLSVPVAADGTFRMCNIEDDVYGEIAAVSGADTSAAYAASFDQRPVLVIVGFVLAGQDVERVATDAPPAADGAGEAGPPPVALRVGRAVITGLVVDTTGTPISGARVALSGAAGASITGSDGRFRLQDQPSGSGILVARKLGLSMTELPVIVSARGDNEFTIRMGTAQTLAEVVVQARRQIALERVGFYQRKQRRRGDFFIDPEQMERMANRSSLATVLNGANNLTYRQGQILGRYRPPRPTSIGGGNVVLSGGYSCVAYVVDGQLWRQYGPNDSPVEYILPHEVVAIEVYRAGEAPLDVPYANYVRGCETVVIWTRARLRVQ